MGTQIVGTSRAGGGKAAIQKRSLQTRAATGSPPAKLPAAKLPTAKLPTAKIIAAKASPTADRAGKIPAGKPAFAPIGGAVPEVAMLQVDDLHIDERYQRSISETGLAHVRRIAAGFHWHKFQPVIVTPRSTGGWSVMDGQHRLAAASLRGIEVVPAQIVSPQEPLALAAQAELFVALNSDRLAVRPIHLYWANVNRGDPEATAVQAACAEAGVSVARFQGTQTQPAKTSATAAIARSLKSYGHDVVVTALTALRMAQALGVAPTIPGGPAGKLDGLLMGANSIRAVAEFVHGRQAAISVARLARAILACGSMDELTDKGRAARRLKGSGTIWTPIAAIFSKAYDSAPAPGGIAAAKQAKDAA
jgi:hypothetical protein